MTQSSLIYRCPHCQQAVEVDDAAVGKTLHCPNENCGKPFEVDAPLARPVASGEVIRGEIKSLKVPSLSEPDEDEIGGAAEETVAVVHPAMFRAHPFKFLGVLMLIGVGIAGLLLPSLGGGLALRVEGKPVLDETVVMFGSGIALLVGAVWLAAWWIRTRFVSLRITTVRSLLRRGFISRQTSEVRHRDVRNLQVDQNFFGRIVGVGDLAISSAGQDEMEITIRGIPHPDRVANRIRQLQ